jgi:hypothetical protein
VRRTLPKRGTGLWAGKEIETTNRRLQHKVQAWLDSGAVWWQWVHSSITLVRLRPSPLGGQRGNVPGSPGPRLAARTGGTYVGAPRLLSTLSKGPSEGSACSRCHHRGDQGETSHAIV